LFKTDAGDLRPRLCLLVVIGVTEDGVKELLALRTTNPVGSRFATVKLRTRVTKGAGSKAAALGMAYKLLRAAEERWRRFTATNSSPTSSPARRSRTGSGSPTSTRTRQTERSPPERLTPPHPQHLTVALAAHGGRYC